MAKESTKVYSQGFLFVVYNKREGPQLEQHKNEILILFEDQ
jgi:hypothetical protein